MTKKVKPKKVKETKKVKSTLKKIIKNVVKKVVPKTKPKNDVVKIKLKPKIVTTEMEIEIINIIKEETKEHKYLKLDDSVIGKIEERTKHLGLPIENVMAIRNAFIRRMVIKRHGMLKQNIVKLYKEFKTNPSIIALSNKYSFTPMNIIRLFFALNDYSKEDIKKILREPEKFPLNKIVPLEQINIAKELDLVSNIDRTIESKLAEEYEIDIGKFLTKYNVKYKTQDDLSAEQTKKFGKPINTPDFLILSDLYINDKKINWIDAKRFYGDCSKFTKTKIEKQIEKYVSKWGYGLLMFKYGFHENLEIKDALLL